MRVVVRSPRPLARGRRHKVGFNPTFFVIGTRLKGLGFSFMRMHYERR
jgi:hypothetical protein